MAPGLADADRAPAIGEAGVARGHEQRAEARQLGDQVLGESLGEIVLLGVAGAIDERDDGDRRPAADPGRGQRTAGDLVVHAGDEAVVVQLPGHLVERDRLRQVLQAFRAERFELQLGLPLDLVEHRPTDGHRAGLRQALDARGDVDPVAEQVLAVDHHVGEVQADAQLERLGIRAPRLGQVALDLEGRPDPRDGALELGEEPVAGAREDAPPAGLDPPVDDLLHLGQPAQRRRFVPLHARRVAADVRRHDRGQATLHASLSFSPETGHEPSRPPVSPKAMNIRSRPG
jgi:hypothetical protein